MKVNNLVNTMLTFEINKEDDQLEIHGDQKGIQKLANILIGLANQNQSDHCHLMTKEWGGSELSSEKQKPDNGLCNHVKVFLWNTKKSTSQA